VALAYGWTLAAQLAYTLTWHPVFGPPYAWIHNVLGVLGNQHLNDEIGRVTSVATGAVAALAVGTMISHWRQATPPGRRVLAPVVWASVPTGVWFVLNKLSGAGWLGAGGADPAGSGLTGLADRVAALGGTLRVTSPPGAGTAVTAELPCGP
jgi:hypothetical protein